MSFNEFNEEWSNILQIQNKSKFVFTLIQGYKNACKIFMFKWGLKQSILPITCGKFVRKLNFTAKCPLRNKYKYSLSTAYWQPNFPKCTFAKKNISIYLFYPLFSAHFLAHLQKNALKNSDYLTLLPLLLVWWMAASNALLIYRKKPNFVLGLQFYHHIYFRTTH